MITRTVAAITVFILTSCAVIPEYEDLIEVTTREGLKEKFGEPDSIRTGKYMPDVTSFRDPSIVFTEFEYWEYVSTKNDETGKTFFYFYLNKEKEMELLDGRHWLSDEETKN